MAYKAWPLLQKCSTFDFSLNSRLPPGFAAIDRKNFPAIKGETDNCFFFFYFVVRVQNGWIPLQPRSSAINSTSSFRPPGRGKASALATGGPPIISARPRPGRPGCASLWRRPGVLYVYSRQNKMRVHSANSKISATDPLSAPWISPVRVLYKIWRGRTE